MPIGDLIRDCHPVRITKHRGEELWHVHRAEFAADAFNPRSTARFSLRYNKKPVAAFYAGDHPETVLWETVLRDCLPDQYGIVALLREEFFGWRLSKLKLSRRIKLVSLHSENLRSITNDVAGQQTWHELVCTDDYDKTHAAARQLAQAVPGVHGLTWISRQLGTEAVYLFYRPPCPKSIFQPTTAAIETIQLGTNAGRRYIERALASARYRAVWG